MLTNNNKTTAEKCHSPIVQKERNGIIINLLGL